ncbi:hypothetical protein NMY22_g14608 [Coprinellus aureogranulatus]|nr:hypothetical protein NMY22_g14608 [Coprinellus aureogranulatus]
MPADTTEPAVPRLFVLEYKARRILVQKPTHYDQLQQLIGRHLPEIATGHCVSYHTKDLPICNGSAVEVTSDVWPIVTPMLKRITVHAMPEMITRMRNTQRLRMALPAASPVARHSDPTLAYEVFIKTLTGKMMTFTVRPATTVLVLKTMHSDREGIPVDQQRLIWGGRQLEDSQTMQELGMQEGSTITFALKLRGGKPVLYLLPPSGVHVEASVKLKLVSEWSFSTIYPIVPISPSLKGGQAIEWRVKAAPDGILLHKGTGLEVAYLFWEAEASKLTNEVPTPFSSPITERHEVIFNPTQPQVNATNSIVLETAKLTPYLDKTLKEFGLHTEARTSFITYWLPAFLKHQHIALRFLPQVAYEKAAPLEVTPAPDVTVRIFMLFKGLKQEDLGGHWAAAMAAAKGDTIQWKNIVGLAFQRSPQLPISISLRYSATPMPQSLYAFTMSDNTTTAIPIATAMTLTSLLNSLHSHLQQQTQLLPTLHAQLGLPSTALEDDLKDLQEQLIRGVERQIDLRRKQVDEWMGKCDAVESICLRYTKALGGNIKATGSSLGEIRKEQSLPRRYELVTEFQEKLRQAYHAKLEQLNTLTNRLNLLARTLGSTYFPQDMLDTAPALDEAAFDQNW